MEEDTNNFKLPVLHIIRDAVLTPLKAWRRLSLALSVSGLTMILLRIAEPASTLEESVLLSLLYTAIHGCVFILFAITCHRYILLGDNGIAKFGIIEWRWREWRYVGWAIVAYFYLFVVILLAGMLAVTLSEILPWSGGAYYYGVISFISVLPGMYVFARLSLVFPATALDRNVTWDWVWDLTQGNGWRLVFVIGLFPLLLSILPALLVGIHFLLDFMLIIVSIVLLAVEVTALSLSFKYLVKNVSTESPV